AHIDAGQTVHVAVTGRSAHVVGFAGRVHRAHREAAPRRTHIVQAVARAGGDAAVAGESLPVAEQAQAHYVGGPDRPITGCVIAADIDFTESAGKADDRATAPEPRAAVGRLAGVDLDA